MNARTYRTNTARPRRLALSKVGTAADSIGPLEKGMEVYCLTFGQFSLIDAIEYLVAGAGPCDAVVSTWTAAHADATRAATMLTDGNLMRFRMIVDRSFATRQPAYCAKVRDLFGDEAIRTTRTHAKFAVITNDEWSLVVRTSMNLNANPRLETIEISDDPALAAFMLEVADAIYAEQAEGVKNGELPVLAGVRVVDAPVHVSMGVTPALGVA